MSMEQPKFNPHNPEYKKVEDLPKEEQVNYSDVEGGFVQKEAAEFYKIAQDIERITERESGSMSADKFMMLLAQDEDTKREWDALTGKQKLNVLMGNPKKEDMDLSTWNTNRSAIEKTLEEHPELRDNKKLMLKLIISGTSQAPGLASEKVRNDKGYALEAVKRNGMALGYLPEEMQDDEDVVMAAVTTRGLALREASPRLQNNREIVAAAITSEDGDFGDIIYASSDEVIESLLDENNPANKDILLKAMNNKHVNDNYKRIASYNPNHPDYQGGQYDEVFKRYEHLHMREKIEKILGENL
ncbi:MAG: hypothetical protein US57_C0003G0015 [Candidatus Moranbacteria bacterium GW2011_GWC2_37_73]|nr:MAG: hypothetical protein UR95_C0003G0044 [Parcubacteria group bacterium GW2011_GWC1_36_108]KKQ01253.1 MAG: hypothetical protein US09_C0001G0013 [Candidatus Moranbacteria bacterium GW2011_GWD1_36_198]KKQ02312.1 MAG: hypothetical protein US10_C0003G0013 [Candidatus Moranbacteria bacterium GW2011_GWD2_36_198]KKQ40207.1 MAG: hypothetical protein US57_C0003G0015 [Candidatus Moranbacteria bacterium GW2011_GWC2_37_73]HAR99709.1 hypothetical protein [Candidatus Moranbacteria bacterium]